MSISKELHFDRFLIDLQAQSQQKIFDILAEETAIFCDTSIQHVRDVFEKRLGERTFGMGDGLAIFDVKSSIITKPMLVLARFDQELDFNSLDGKDVDLMVAVISPQNDVSSHLQRLAHVSRVLRSADLRSALRDARDIDAMKVLFMPTQDWMIAA